VKTVRTYADYQEYIEYQKQKTTDPVKRKKWLTEEWDSKIAGFKQEFSKLAFLTPQTKALCLGARTGQEVEALRQMGLTDVVGIDIVPHEPLVVEGDIHNLQFEDGSFDLVYTNILDHSIDPVKMISEAERVLKVGGVFYLQIQVGISQDEYTEFEIKEPILGVLPLFNSSFCHHLGFVRPDRTPNFAGMNFEYLFVKDARLVELFEKHGNVNSVEVPSNFEKIWQDINEPIQQRKLDQNNIINLEERQSILTGLKRRAFYLTRIAEVFDCKNIAEVGTAEGWQFYSFCEYAAEIGGTVYSCDPRDVRHPKYIEKFESESGPGRFTHGNSQAMVTGAKDVDMFYIDGLHDEGTVIHDALTVTHVRRPDRDSVWVYDDFDVRFGCYMDIIELCMKSSYFKVYKVGKTASGNDNHQAIVIGSVIPE